MMILISFLQTISYFPPAAGPTASWIQRKKKKKKQKKADLSTVLEFCASFSGVYVVYSYYICDEWVNGLEKAKAFFIFYFI